MALRRQAFFVAVASALVCGAGSTAEAATPEPSGPHPRLWLDAGTQASLKKLAQKNGSAVSRAIQECKRVSADPKENAKNVYMGFGWAASTSSCALAYRVTGDVTYAQTALLYFRACLDDWETVGDGKGGDSAPRHDSGYAIRACPVHTAIAYDWLHDAPGMTPALLAHARARFSAWNDWYYGNGYRFKDPGTNYHAGYLFAVTTSAIAQGSEGGPAGTKLWRHVADQVWGREMDRVAQPGGVLDGGEWGEGWQYGPLAVVSYALSARAMIGQGVPLPAYERWAEQLFLRHVHALGPASRAMFVAGDTESETPNIPQGVFTLIATTAGPSPAQAAGWAKAERDHLRLSVDHDGFLVFEALAEARDVPAAPFPRETTPTSYLARGTGVFFARSSWSPTAVWMAMQCTRTLNVDHLPANAGNFVLTRGADDLVVDPSPYGSLTSQTSNAPTVESGNFPAEYAPGQGYWSEKTGYTWSRQAESAIVAARCDYADQYRFQERPSDVPMAMRDVVLVPSGDGNATAVVVDRARTGADSRALYIKFRTLASLVLGPGGAAQGSHGRSSLTITPVYVTSGKGELRSVPKGDCFAPGIKRGSCEAARFAVQDYMTKLKGGEATAVHVLDLAGAGTKVAPPQMTTAPDHRVISFERGTTRASVVIGEPNAKTAKLTYRAAPGHHVVLDPPASSAGRSDVTAVRAGSLCDVTVAPASSGGLDARPLVLVVSDACEVKNDGPLTRPLAIDGPIRATTASVPLWPAPDATAAGGSDAAPPRTLPDPGGGSCGCGGVGKRASRNAAALSLVGVVLLARRRRDRRVPRGR